MWHVVFLVLHALAGVVALAAGIAALVRGRFLRLYRTALVGMAGFLVLAIAVSAGERDAASWAVSGALVGLAVVMVTRAARARPGGRAHVFDVGFGVVGLVDAFWVVTLLRVGLPGWAVVAVAAGVAVAGHLLLVRIADRDRGAVGSQGRPGPHRGGGYRLGRRAGGRTAPAGVRRR
jgi:hypothetical protein